MAAITYGSGFSTKPFENYNARNFSATPTTLHVQDTTRTIDVQGQFSVDRAGRYGGTITSYTETFGGQPALTVVGASADAGVINFLLGTGDYGLLVRTLTAGNDSITATAVQGREIYAGGGFDTVRIDYVGDASALTRSANVTTVTSATAGTVKIYDAERVQIGNAVTAYDIDGNAGQVYRLYEAAFDRVPDGPGLSHNVGLVDRSLTLRQMADAFTISPEFQARYGAQISDQAFVTALYQNVLGRGPDAAGLADWLGRLAAGQSRGDVLIGFSESAENHGHVDPSIANGIHLDYGFLV